ncbi:MAG: hypothetical protein HUU15_05410 [Candidatus Brocadiae bacterium]|nr:hypothetical protein [Candidatus Brocadiia bacterium]
MRHRLFTVLFAAALALPCAAEMLQKKSGSFIEGEVLEVTERGVRIRLMEGGEATLPFEDLDPYTVYRVRDRQAAKSGKETAVLRFDLGRYAMQNGLYDIGRADMERACKDDPSLKTEMDKVVLEVEERDGARMYEEGLAAMKASDFSTAMIRFQALVETFPASKYVEESRKSLAAAAAEIEKENARKKELLEALTKKKADGKAAKVEEGVKGKLDAAIKAYDDSRRLNAEGLEFEGNTSVSKADKSFRAAEGALIASKDLIMAVAAGSKDVEVLAAAKKLEADTDAMLVVVYGNLGHLWAVERYYKESTKWLNRALAIDPANHFATELKLQVAAQQIRRSYSPERDR